MKLAQALSTGRRAPVPVTPGRIAAPQRGLKPANLRHRPQGRTTRKARHRHRTAET